ncbi:MAG: TetR/AcrR family transcriptional regulator [Deltaproteobacteria bacterium]|nr:TetR/AcrR family transcriptional regulator [Deltaproteobacteria bacterium]MBW1736029.1 TetR/AcrR family transcriptional regulator [Deltaproteobacteria bacterium]MBW1909329.1 TetR/AcrR family transcriptional regulator [Deltaproteobacteria bacterium]MBW2032335.1 TetR/AcrR family transcriptional regulator [Deltaproteobacteria bacterium]MBW2113321.1 TetR/AcrR family transcriptional regulator [Deltaproteobacteria bacterium]
MGIAERKEREKDLQQKMRRKQILDAAKRVFHNKGFSATTVEDICQEAELSPAALYLYFKNKDDLYASLNLQLLEYMSEKFEGLYREKGLKAEEKIEALKDLLYDLFSFDPLIVINLFHLQASDGLTNLSTERTTQLNELAAKCLRTLGKIFEDGIAEGRFIDRHPIALADIIWIIFSGAVLWEKSKQMINPRKDYLKQTLDLAIDIFGRGIKAA